jgi:signal transduction histidine kinase
MPIRTSITFRVVLLTNLLVLATVTVVALLAGQVSATVAEDRLIRDSAARAIHFIQAKRLPLSDAMMRDLAQVFGTEFIAVAASDDAILGASIAHEHRPDDFERALGGEERIDVTLSGVDYRAGLRTFMGHDKRAVKLYVLMPLQDLRDARVLARAQTLLAVAPAGAVATLLGFILSLTITRPIRRLVRQMDSTATSQREPGAETPPGFSASARGPREVAQLAASFEQLLERLGQAQDELVRSQRLAALGRVAASAAHELKNPLSGIKMHLRLLQDEPAFSAHKEDIDVLIREVDRMDLYLQQLTDVASGSPGEDGQGLIPPEAIRSVDLAEIVSSVLRIQEGRCRHAGITVECQYHVDAPAARAAPDRLRQVLMNLMINAIEAMPAGGSVTVQTQATPSGDLRLSVTDTGAGVKLSPPDRVFELFASTKGENAGLGLYIAKQLVLAQGGRIGCESSDRGATFWIELPASSAADQETARVNGDAT